MLAMLDGTWGVTHQLYLLRRQLAEEYGRWTTQRKLHRGRHRFVVRCTQFRMSSIRIASQIADQQRVRLPQYAIAVGGNSLSLQKGIASRGSRSAKHSGLITNGNHTSKRKKGESCDRSGTHRVEEPWQPLHLERWTEIDRRFAEARERALLRDAVAQLICSNQCWPIVCPHERLNL